MTPSPQTPSSTPRRARRAALPAVLAAGALLMLAQPAAAIPGAGGPGQQQPLAPVNEPPVAAFSISPNPALVSPELHVAKPNAIQLGPVGLRNPVTFDAGASTDDTGIASYAWDLDGNGTYEISGKRIARTYTTPGARTIRLRVTDGHGASRVAARVLIVHRPPRAVLAPRDAAVLVGQSLLLKAVGSTDDNGIARYDWDLDGDGTYETASGLDPSASASFATLGARTVRVRVTDVLGATDTASAAVAVHRAPTAAFTVAPAAPTAGTPATFDASSSADDGPIASYAWDLDGDGTFETDTQKEPTVTRTYAAPGTVDVRLRVTDAHGVQDVIARSVTVVAPPAAPVPPGADPGPADTQGPAMRITPRSVKLGRSGKVAIRLLCPVGERSCSGRLTLRSVRGAATSSLGRRAFELDGGQRVTLRFQLAKGKQRLVRERRRMQARAVAVATDAAGNQRTTRAAVTIRR